MKRNWYRTPILCDCQSYMISDGISLPVCPDCGHQMTLHDVLEWLIAPTHPLPPEIEAELKLAVVG